ncbi:hypothetical protein HNQ59_002644 [Chitinivorax tropicus]|uniref:DUF4136 domain-containing protein n=1 Tax=Chitinivorax tropicus TaxID=714531 RepID=A0A840MSU0_9PROT|nr:DUF4136 domain-containing protein [Chitinivorax tropicus]MBB5019343.1 hypothetical protein [Chitinivorax tropicus]
MKKMLAIASLLATVTGCAGTVDVVTDNEQSLVPGSKYAWGSPPPKPTITPDNADIDNDIIRDRLQRAIDIELERQGFQKGTAADARYLVSYHIGVATKQRVVSEPRFGGMMLRCGSRTCWSAYDWGIWGPPYETTRTYDYREGSLIIDFRQRDGDKLVWRGIYKNTIWDGVKLDERRVQDIVFDVLKRLPK